MISDPISNNLLPNDFFENGYPHSKKAIINKKCHSHVTNAHKGIGLA